MQAGSQSVEPIAGNDKICSGGMCRDWQRTRRSRLGSLLLSGQGMRSQRRRLALRGRLFGGGVSGSPAWTWMPSSVSGDFRFPDGQNHLGFHFIRARLDDPEPGPSWAPPPAEANDAAVMHALRRSGFAPTREPQTADVPFSGFQALWAVPQVRLSRPQSGKARARMCLISRD